jgi:hypothetical protein
MNYSKEQMYIVRTCNAGVFAGYIKDMDDVNRICTLTDARRLWYWDGASSLSELAVQGTSKPDKCKFPCIVPEVTLFEVVEILTVTDKARQSLRNVAVWSQHE